MRTDGVGGGGRHHTWHEKKSVASQFAFRTKYTPRIMYVCFGLTAGGKTFDYVHIYLAFSMRKAIEKIKKIKAMMA